MKLFVKITVIAATVVVTVFVFARWLEYLPDVVETIEVQKGGSPVGDTVNILSWNIGYCGYDSDMDFFYDGGKSVLASKNRTKRNLDSVITLLERHKDVDFILLQEVDRGSKRSYGMNYLDSIMMHMDGFTSYYAPNFRSPFVPIPLTNPIGQVESGIVILTRHPALTARRYRLPNTSKYPQRIFELKRCLLETEFLLSKGDTLKLYNLHNSAYDDGSQRREELRVIDCLARQKNSIFIGDWNCNPPGYVQSEKEKTDPNFSPILLSKDDIHCKGFAADYGHSTMRYLDKPYIKGETAESLLDFMAYTEGIEVLDVKTVQLDFRNSDHNPVLYRITFNQEAESR